MATEPRQQIREGYLALSHAIRDLCGMCADLGIGDWAGYEVNKACILAARAHVTQACEALSDANRTLLDTNLQTIIQSLAGRPRAAIQEPFGPIRFEGSSFAEVSAAWVDRRALTRVTKELQSFVAARSDWKDLHRELQAIDEERISSVHSDISVLTLHNPLVQIAIAIVATVATLIWWTF